jgi:hypothetical protein
MAVMNNIEEWRLIGGEFNNYQISSHARVRNISSGRIFFGCPMISSGYWNVTLTNDMGIAKSRYIHILVADSFIPNHENLEELDHINRDKSDNCLSNLRRVTHSENMRNRSKAAGKSSIYKGVSLIKKTGKWIAQIRAGGQNKKIGIFTKEIDAARAYNNQAVIYFGRYACLNEIEVEEIDEENDNETEDEESEDEETETVAE